MRRPLRARSLPISSESRPDLRRDRDRRLAVDRDGAAAGRDARGRRAVPDRCGVRCGRARFRSHPNLVRTYDVTEIDGLPSIVMELLPGETLEGGALSRTDAASVADALASDLIRISSGPTT